MTTTLSPPTLNLDRELARMGQLPIGELKTFYEETFGEECRSNNRAYLTRRIAWRLQANAEGDLSERARRRAMEIADDADLRLKAPSGTASSEAAAEANEAATTPIRRSPRDPRLPAPGAVLVRRYKGHDLRVTVLDDGLEWEGEHYPSVSAVAKAITGTHTNGFLFFKLGTHAAKGGER